MDDAQSTPVMVRLSAAQVRAVDEWRRVQEDLPSRPEAIRRLVELGLKASEDGHGPGVRLRK